MNTAQHTSSVGTTLIGVRALLIAPGLRARHGVPPTMVAGPVGSPVSEPAGPHPSEGMPPARTTVLAADVESRLRARWSRVREAFADDPRGGVQDADALLQDVSAEFTEAIEEHRARLAAGWQVGRPGVDRLQDALRHYDGLLGVLLRQP